MQEQTISLDVEEAVKILSRAVNEQPGNVEEIFQLLTQLPDVTGTYLPFDLLQKSYATDNSDDSCQNLHTLFETIARYYVDRIKRLLEVCLDEKADHVSKPGKLESICQCVESLRLLGGSEYAKVKFSGALSKRTDVILQNEMQYVAGASENIKLIEKIFTVLINSVKTLALDVIFVLFSCQGLNMTSNELLNFISDPVLEKLSVELLTLVDALKSGVCETSPNSTMQSIGNSSQTNLFTALTATIGEDVQFSSEQLFALANIISLFLDLENSLRNSEHTKFLKTQLKNERSKKSSLRSRSQLPDLLRSSQESSWLQSSQIYGNWNWQEILKDIGPILVKSITRVFEDCQTSSIGSAKTAYDQDERCNLPMMQSISSTVLSGPGIPKQTLSCFGEVLKLMKCFLPYAILGSQYKPLSGLCSCYVDECGQSLKNMKTFLLSLINDFPSKTSISNMYQVLATCEDACTMLSFCASKMDPEPRVPFQGISQLYRDLNDMVKNLIMQHQTAKLSTHILNDAESHHWSDPREFNEGESCSYSIKMWDLFLEQLSSDLGSCVSKVQQTKIFAHIFTNSLQFLEVRYIRCEPSYNRTKQIVFDIMAILAICRKYIFHTSIHAHGIFFNELPESMLENRLQTSQILKTCKTLLTVLCVVSSPIDVIEEWLQSSSKISKGIVVHSFSYISLLYPSVIPPDWSGHFSDLPGGSVIFCVLEHAHYRPMELACCFYALVLRNLFLLKKIMSNEFVLNKTSKAALESDIYTIFTASSLDFQDVFFQCAFKSVGENAETLLDLSISSEHDADVNNMWQKRLHSTLQATLCTSMDAVGKYINSLTWSPTGLMLISSLPHSLKKQVIDLSGDGNNDDKKNCEMAAILLLIQGIKLAMHTFPDWLIVFLSQTEDVVKTSTNVDSNLENSAFNIIVHSVCNILKEPNIWEQCHGIVFNQKGIECMQRMSELLLALCSKGADRLQAGLEVFVVRELGNLKEKVTALCHNVQKSPDYTDEQLFDVCQHHVSHLEVNCKNAIESLSRLADVLFANRSLIYKVCDLKNRPNNSYSDSTTQAESSFDPVCHSVVNDSGIGHDGNEINWQVLCNKILPAVSEKTLKSLLSNRWEMKEGAYLNEEQSEISRRLKEFLVLTNDSHRT